MMSATERWTAVRDREACGELLSAAELSELAKIEAADVEVQAYVQQMRELEAYLEDKPNQRLTASDRELAQRALSAVQVTSPSARLRAGEVDAELARAVNPEGPGWIRLVATTFSVAMAVGAAFALIVYEPRSVRRATGTGALGATASEPSAAPALVPQVEALASVRTAERGGRLRRAGRLLGSQVLLSQGDEISAGEKPGCIVIEPTGLGSHEGNIDVCIGANSTLRLTSLFAHRTELDVKSGRAAVNLGADVAANALTLLAGEVRAAAYGGVFGLERNDDASLVRVRALRGELRLQAGARQLSVPEAQVGVFRAQEGSLDALELPPAQAQREWELVAAGQAGSGFAAPAATASPSTPGGATPSVAAVEAPLPEVPSAPAEAKTARDLMQEAWELLKAERWTDAASVYERISADYPQSEEAHIVLVRLGDLLLERLASPERALAAFDGYLRQGGGPLEAEAHYGRISAFRRLSRPADERAAIEEFLRLHAQSPKAPMLDARLRVLMGAAH